jgi:hypothetical protein
MKRLYIIVSVISLAGLAVGLLCAKERFARLEISTLQEQQTEITNLFAKDEAEQSALQRSIAAAKTERRVFANKKQLSAKFTDWLIAGDFSQIPESLVAELRAELNFPANTSSDFVLISKPTLQILRPPSPNRNDKLSDTFCALLGIASDQREKLQSALSNARHEFADWGKQNLQREDAQGDTLFRYTLPAGEDFANSVTNRLLATISDTIGSQRTGLFRAFAEDWFQIETGYLGGVTNTLAVLRQPDEKGQLALFYKLTREGNNSSMSEGPGEIHPQYFPPAWRNLFPGGWAEVARREGLEFPGK